MKVVTNGLLKSGEEWREREGAILELLGTKGGVSETRGKSENYLLLLFSRLLRSLR